MMMIHHDNDIGGVVMAFGYYNNPSFMTTTVSTSHTSPNHSLRYRMSRTSSTTTSTTTTRCHSQQSDDDNNIKNNNRNRRSVLQQLTFTTTTFSTVVVTTLFPSVPARAVTNNNNNKLFQSNTLLTNPILEQLRIWEQEEADNIKYNGELERGDAGNQGKINAYPSLLIPILAISQDISYLYQLLVVVHHQEEEEDRRRRTTPPPPHPVLSYRTALNVLTLNQTNAYDTIPFKRTFNAYADNVYYSDPDRANMYLGGGGT